MIRFNGNSSTSISTSIGINLPIVLIFYVLQLLLPSCTQLFMWPDMDGDWEVVESERIVLHYRPQGYTAIVSPDRVKAEEMLVEQELAYTAILDRLKLQFSDRINIYLYNEDEALEKIGTSGGGHAITEYNSFYYTYWDRDIFLNEAPGISHYMGAHELVHVITHQAVGLPGNRVLSEGLAVAVDGVYGVMEDVNGKLERIPIPVWVRHWKSGMGGAHRKLVSPRELFQGQYSLSEDVFYTQSGAFTLFLLEKYGDGDERSLREVCRLLTVPPDEISASLKKLTGYDLDQIQAPYMEYLEDMVYTWQNR